MPKSIEITPAERAKLSKETLLRWYKSQSRVKLKALRKEILEANKAGAKGKIEKLKAIIIKNTKEELKKHKNLTEKQRDTKAREFANKLITLALANKSFDQLAQSFITKGGAREDLFEVWKKNNPNRDREVLKSEIKYEALRDIADNTTKARAFVLLGLIEKSAGGREVAKKLYEKGLKGRKFDIDVLRAHFTKEKAASTVGFYYGTRVITWDPEWKTFYTDKKYNKHTDFKWKIDRGLPNDYKVYVKGWWAWDEGENNKNFISGGYNFRKHILSKLRGGGYGDEWMGKDILTAISNKKNNLLKELHRETDDVPSEQRDSGLTREREGEVRQALVELTKSSKSTYSSKVKTDLLTWFKRQPRNKWIALDKNQIGPMCYVYGSTCGRYLYRVTKDRIYVIGIEGEKTDPRFGRGSYIEIKNGKLGKWMGGKDGADSELMLKKELLSKLTEAEVKKELAEIKVENKQGTRLEKLQATAGICFRILRKLPKTTEYNRIKDVYIPKLKIVIKSYLINRRKYKGKEELAEELAAIRAEEVQKNIYAFIENPKNEYLSKAVEDNDKEKLTIDINTTDDVTVDLHDKNKKKKLLQWAKRKFKETVTTAKDVADSTMSKLEKRLEKFLGPLTPVAMWFLNKFFKIGDAFKKMAKGGTSLFGGILTSFLGIKVSKDILKSRKITREVIEKLPPKKKKYYKFNKQMYFDENVELKGKKIVIPEGKGIKPGKEFKVAVKGIRDKVTVLPVKEAKGSLWGIFGRRREVYRMQEREITITDKTTIPKGTVIPKGAKIYKV